MTGIIAPGPFDMDEEDAGGGGGTAPFMGTGCRGAISSKLLHWLSIERCLYMSPGGEGENSDMGGVQPAPGVQLTY